MKKSIRAIVASAAVALVILVVGCASIQKDFETAKRADTIEEYEKFLAEHPQGPESEWVQTRLQELHEERDWEQARRADTISDYEWVIGKYPKGKFAQQARKRMEKLTAGQDWKEAITIDTIEAYEEFLEKHDQGEFSDQARSRAKKMKNDLPDWEKAQEANTIKAFLDFLQKHPNSPFAEKAKGKIVDLEVSDIMRADHGKLPSGQKISSGGDRTYSVLNIHNDTEYNLTL